MSAGPASGSAPGRIDFIGGVADYSGSLVLQYPIDARTTVTLTAGRPGTVELRADGEAPAVLPLGELTALLEADASPEAFGDRLRALELPVWSHYLLGCLYVFTRAKNWRPEGGLRFTVRSNVPRSMGVSSSAALEIATLRALESFSGIACAGLEIAHLGQAAENRVVGAPCGLMDQLASAFAPPGKLLPILCRPDILGDPIELPPGTVVAGWPSGVKHAVSGTPYATARAAAFMGKRILEDATGEHWNHAAEIPLGRLRSHASESLPVSMRGDAFLSRFGNIDDPQSTINPHQPYPVRAALSFAVEENARCEEAVRLLSKDHGGDTVPQQLGSLLYASHAGYQAINLSCPGVDAMVAAVRERGPTDGFHGARISGGGSGGTVVVLLENEALPRLEALAQSISPDHPLPLIR